MKAIVLGIGIQGKAVVHDLSQSDLIDEIIAVDIDLSGAAEFLSRSRYNKVRRIEADALDPVVLADIIASSAADVLVCMMPSHLSGQIAEGCIEAGVPYVCTTYARILDGLDEPARRKGVLLMPEMGFDPGIDLVLGAKAVAQLDEVHGLDSYGSGVPELDVCDNPINYKISWTFDGVLTAYTRPARIIKDGREVEIPGSEIFTDPWVELMEIPGVGTMESYPNGDAVHFIDRFGLGPELKAMGRYTTRWPGHCAFWRTMSQLGFLADEALDLGDGISVSPKTFVSRLLTPQLQYGRDERDLAFLRVHAWGLKDGREKSITYDLVDYRDLETGLFAMNRTVGYTASIAAQMILRGDITGSGVRSPVNDVDADILLKELSQRGVEVTETIR